MMHLLIQSSVKIHEACVHGMRKNAISDRFLSQLYLRNDISNLKDL
jgi:hypothetical protein